MRNKYLYITLLSFVGIHGSCFALHVEKVPRLVVSIHVDQLSTSQLESYAPLYTSEGLKCLLNQGVIFTNGACNFTPVDVAAASAAMSTGTAPYYNGIIGSEWLNKTTLRPQSSLLDAQFELSPQLLATSTLGDELKIATDGLSKVFSFAPTAESAVLLAGHAADGAAWISNGAWGTTSYYAPLNQWLNGYTELNPPVADVNSSVAEAAISCIEQSGIGIDEHPDLLYVTLTVQPTLESYVQLDHTISRLLSATTHRVPLERTLFVLTGTGTVSEEPRDVRERFRIPTGKFYINRTANLLNIYLGAIYGSEQYVEACFCNQLFLNRQIAEKKNINFSDLLRRSQEFILQLSGVRNVYTANQLVTSDSHLLERVRNGFNIDRCGDLMIDILPGWELINEDTNTSVTACAATIPFPIIFYGAGTRAQRISTRVTTDRVAPTVARTIRIRAPNACQAEPLF